MAIVHEALVCEGYWCMGQAGFVLLLFVVAVCCFFVFCFFFISVISSLFLHTLLYLFMIAFQNIYILYTDIRYRNHVKSFKHKKYAKETTLSKYVWKLK